MVWTATILISGTVAYDDSYGFDESFLESEILLEYETLYVVTNPQDYKNTKYILSKKQAPKYLGPS